MFDVPQSQHLVPQGVGVLSPSLQFPDTGMENALFSDQDEG